MRRTFSLLVMFLLLLFTAAYFYLSGLRKGRPERGRDFAVTDTSRVDRIEIIRGKDSVLLERQAAGWTVNSNHDARERLVGSLLTALMRLESDVPAPSEQQELIRAKLRGHGSGVRIFSKRRLLKAYRVCHDSTGSGTSYMMMTGSDTPYRVYLPGAAGLNVASLYRAEEQFWREKILFNLSPDQIARVRVVHADRPGASFELARDDHGNWKLIRLSDNKVMEDASPASIQRYLSYFARIGYDRVTDPPPVPSEVPGNRTGIRMRVERTDGRVSELKFLPKFSDQGEPDPDRLYIVSDHPDEVLLARYVQVDLILKDAGYFTDRDP